MIGLLILLGFALALLMVLLTAMLAWEMRHPPRHTAAYAIARGLAADPGELGLTFESWTLDRPDGAQLPVWDLRIVNRQSSIVNPFTAVFIHGWGHSRIDSLSRIKPLDELCDRIVMYDLRGHGETPGSARLGDSEADDLLALLDRIEGPIVLVGHSMGAVIALRAAIKRNTQHSARSTQHPAVPIAGIVAHAPYCEFHQSLIGRLHSAGLPGQPITDLALLLHRIMGVCPSSVEMKELQSLDVPLLIVHGTNDSVAPIEHARRIAAAVPDATLVEIPDAGHTDAHILSESQYHNAVRAFISRIVAPSPQQM